jgi:hypothetical protein
VGAAIASVAVAAGAVVSVAAAAGAVVFVAAAAGAVVSVAAAAGAVVFVAAAAGTDVAVEVSPPQADTSILTVSSALAASRPPDLKNFFKSRLLLVYIRSEGQVATARGRPDIYQSRTPVHPARHPRPDGCQGTALL